MITPVLIPELCVRDVAAAAAQLTRVFGFQPDGRPGRLRLGSQQVRLRADTAVSGHGVIDHLALAVNDVATALAAAQARGGLIDQQVTPGGQMFIPEFWDHGVHYVFLEGPEGARIELCARPHGTARNVPGHDHIGIACADLPAMRDFFLSLGLVDRAAITLKRASGDVQVCFMALSDAPTASVVELYAPSGRIVAPHRPVTDPFWRRLILTGGGAQGDLPGPEGIVVTREAN